MTAPATSRAPESRSRPARAGTRRIAAIDIGSNSVRQIVADVAPDGTIDIVDEMKAAPRLAAGLAREGVLSMEAIERAVAALSRMATLARQLGATRIEAVATSAVRDAANAADLLSRVERETGLRVRVLDGAEEARLSYLSAVAHFELGVGRTAVVDIGGGSTELALSAEGIVDHLASLPLGAIRLTEKFLAGDDRPKALRRLRRHVAETLREAGSLRAWRGARFIGSGGTFTNLAAIQLARAGLQSARSVHEANIARDDVEHILEWLHALTPEERREVPGLNPERADIIVAGLAVAAEVMARLDARGVLVSRYGIREGLLLQAARVTPAIADPGDARERSVREFARRCHFDEPHADQVRRLALRLFDRIGARIGCEASDRQILADAALLHDVGYHISHERHHKHSYHLILHAELLGVPPEEQVLVAHVARYHRGAAPKKRHRAYGALEKRLRWRIERLAALLRLADGLDRGHSAAVGELAVRWFERAIRVTPLPAKRGVPLRLDIWGAQRKSGLLADLAGRPVEIVDAEGEVFSSETLEADEAT